MNDIENGWLGSEDKGWDKEYDPEFTCDWCGEDIYEGDDYYDFDGDTICYDCIESCRKKA